MLLYKKSSKLITITVVIVALLFFLHFLGILKPVENLIVVLTKPVFSRVYNLSNWIGTEYLSVQSRQALIHENNELKDRVDTLLQEKSTCLAEQEENSFLREQLSFITENNFDYTIARVVGKNIDNIQNTLILDKGEKHGVITGTPVITDQGMMIGKVIKVNKYNSLILLLNDDLSKIAAKIQNKDKTMGLVEGEYGLGIKMRLIPQTEVVKKGDMVVTSGLEEHIPPNIVIGQINQVSNEPEELFQEASVRSSVDFNKITLVTIIKSQYVE